MVSFPYRVPLFLLCGRGSQKKPNAPTGGNRMLYTVYTTACSYNIYYMYCRRYSQKQLYAQTLLSAFLLPIYRVNHRVMVPRGVYNIIILPALRIKPVAALLVPITICIPNRPLTYTGCTYCQCSPVGAMYSTYRKRRE